MSDFIPDSQFKPDSAPASESTQSGTQFIPDSQFVPDNASAEQQANAAQAHQEELQSKQSGKGVLAAIEAPAEGILGPIASGSAKLMREGASKLGIPEKYLNRVAPSMESLREREEAFPITHAIGEIAGLMSPVGQGAVLEKIGAKVAAPIIGEGILKGATRGAVKLATENALYQAGDEVSKMIKEDPNQSVQSAVANVGLAGLIGGAGGAVLGSVSPLWKATVGEKAGQIAQDFKARIREHLELPEEAPSVASTPKEVFDPFTKEKRIIESPIGPAEPHERIDPFKVRKTAPMPEATYAIVPKAKPRDIPETQPLDKTTGGKLADMFIKHADNLSGRTLAAGIGAKIGQAMQIPYGGTIGAVLGERALGPFLESVLPAISRPLMEKIVSSEGLKAATDYGMAVLKGQNTADRMIKSIFKAGTSYALPKSTLPSPETRKKLNTALEVYQKDPEKITSIGGAIGHYLPNHAVAIGSLASNSVGFLNSIKPQETPRAPLDPPRVISSAVQSQYNRALDIAQQPMIVVDSIKDGTLTSHDVIALHTLYPSLYNSLRQQVMNNIIEHQASGETVPYNTRMGLSVFLGQPLDSTMQPQAIASAQPSPEQQAQRQQESPQAKNMSQGAASTSLKGSKMAQTASQSAEAMHVTGKA